MKVDKSLLSKLRKETGFGFAKCMESLQLCNNDYDEAITWLKAEAEKQGWEKATKLQGRAAAEGLVGVMVDGNFGAMVEVSYVKFSDQICASFVIVFIPGKVLCCTCLLMLVILGVDPAQNLAKFKRWLRVLIQLADRSIAIM